jgi:hypothetical protein
MDTASEMAIEIVMSWKGTVLETDLVSAERPRSVFVGNEGAVRFIVPAELMPGRHALVACEGEPGSVRYVVRAPAGGELVASKNGEMVDASEIGIEKGVIAEVRIGDFTFFVQPCAQPEKTPAGPLFDGGASRYIAAVLAAHAVMLGAFFFLPPAASALNLDRMTHEDAYITAHLTPPQRIDEILPVDSGGESNGEAPSDAPAESGERGGEDPTPRPAGGHGRPDASSTRHDVPVTASTVASLGTFSAIATAFDHAGATPGTWGSEYLADGIGGPGIAVALPGGGGSGPGGIDMVGIGIGTCRPGEVCGRGTIGVGRLATRGGVGPGPGTGTGVRDDRPSVTPDYRTVTTTTGGLSREAIQHTIRRHMNEVRFCYERELSSNPSLEGRVSVTFMVDATGTVRQANAAGEGMSDVSSCVATAVRRWTFPESEGPTGVTYPFVFQSGE